MAIALFDLAMSVVARPAKESKKAPNTLHWTKFDKPFEEMTDAERRAAAELLADEILGVIKDEER